jgi:hypothetical protein
MLCVCVRRGNEEGGKECENKGKILYVCDVNIDSMTVLNVTRRSSLCCANASMGDNDFLFVVGGFVGVVVVVVGGGGVGAIVRG